MNTKFFFRGFFLPVISALVVFGCIDDTIEPASGGIIFTASQITVNYSLLNTCQFSSGGLNGTSYDINFDYSALGKIKGITKSTRWSGETAFSAPVAVTNYYDESAGSPGTGFRGGTYSGYISITGGCIRFASTSYVEFNYTITVAPATSSGTTTTGSKTFTVSVKFNKPTGAN